MGGSGPYGDCNGRRPRRAHEVNERFGPERTAEIISLDQIAAVLAQILQLRQSLYPFSYHFFPEILGHDNDRPRNRRSIGITGHTLNE